MSKPWTVARFWRLEAGRARANAWYMAMNAKVGASFMMDEGVNMMIGMGVGGLDWGV